MYKFSVAAFFALVSFCACKSAPVVQAPLVVQEIAPVPRSLVVQKAVEYEPVYAVYKIIEIGEVNGVQRTFLVRLEANRTGVTVGVTGDIAADTEFQKILGTFIVSGITGNFLHCRIEQLDYKLDTANSYIRIQTGEQPKKAE